MSLQNDSLLSNLDFLPAFELTGVAEDLNTFDLAQLGKVEPDIDQPAPSRRPERRLMPRRGQGQPNTDFSDSETFQYATPTTKTPNYLRCTRAPSWKTIQTETREQSSKFLRRSLNQVTLYQETF